MSPGRPAQSRLHDQQRRQARRYGRGDPPERGAADDRRRSRLDQSLGSVTVGSAQVFGTGTPPVNLGGSSAISAVGNGGTGANLNLGAIAARQTA
jgi:hypothetical protein